MSNKTNADVVAEASTADFLASLVKAGKLSAEQAKAMSFAADNADKVQAVAEGKAVASISVNPAADRINKRSGKMTHYKPSLAVRPAATADNPNPRTVWLGADSVFTLADNPEDFAKAVADLREALKVDAASQAAKLSD